MEVDENEGTINENKILSLEELFKIFHNEPLDQQSCMNNINNPDSKACYVEVQGKEKAVQKIPKSTLIGLVSHVTRKFITFEGLHYYLYCVQQNGFQKGDELYFSGVGSCGPIEFIPKSQRNYLYYFVAAALYKEAHHYAARMFKTFEQVFEGCSEQQIFAGQEMLRQDLEVPCMLRQSQKDEIQSYAHMIGMHLWGSDFKEMMQKIGATPIGKLILLHRSGIPYILLK